MDLISLLYNYGVSTIFAPALTVFTLLYGLIRKTKILGNNEKLYFIISLAFTLYFIYSLQTVEYTIRFLSVFSLGLITLFMFLIAISVIYPSGKKPPVIVPWIGIALLIALYKASQSSPEVVEGIGISTWEIFKIYFIDTGIFVWIIMLLSFYVFYKFLTGEKPSGEKAKKYARALLIDEDEFKKLFKKE